MGKLHKDMAMFMLQTAQEEDSSEQQLIKVRRDSLEPRVCPNSWVVLGIMSLTAAQV